MRTAPGCLGAHSPVPADGAEAPERIRNFKFHNVPKDYWVAGLIDVKYCQVRPAWWRNWQTLGT